MPDIYPKAKNQDQTQLYYQLVDYTPSDAAGVSSLFHLAVSNISHPRYNQAQLLAWSQAPRSTRHWRNQLQYAKTWLVIANNPNESLQEPLKGVANGDDGRKLIGVISLETQFKHQGYISHLYVTPEAQGQGVGRQLLLNAEYWALEQNYSQLSTDASYVSKALFERHGFSHQGKSFQHKLGQVLTGFHMTKALAVPI
ncbi:GNAT family N-acetyltransferase [Shewanella sp. SR44-3]|uniref:GNAT family N-acetyltransferase n=1 Tax=Shewanella sp. SR44-3 TaxID=2760936 RepID=UPI0015F9B324|nr:GNAT family N-acetyltransferase [Shewanella sp. SR44-3]MBB1268150.1 GNAT family N-acetyltransferase [Shewanella sp. SR44-3]